MITRYIYHITPVPKPRQTRSDKWKTRPCVVRYRAFADWCRANVMTITDNDHITFVMPMPESWSAKKKAAHNGKPHRQRPDIDNIWKATADACHPEDSHIARMSAEKVWGYAGQIIIDRRE